VQRIGLLRSASFLLAFTLALSWSLAPEEGLARAPAPVPSPSAQATTTQEQPLVLEADRIEFNSTRDRIYAQGNVRLSYKGIRLAAREVQIDLRREELVARGEVVLIEEGRELRSQALVYDLRNRRGRATDAETLLDRIFYRGRSLDVTPDRLLGDDVLATTCNPERPIYHITARKVEVIPGRRIIARDASLWVGGVRVVTLPYVQFSAGDPRSLGPRVGYNPTDGWWIDYSYAYEAGTLPALLYLKYGTKSGMHFRNTATFTQPTYSATFVVGRDQDKDLNTFDRVDLTLAMPPQRLGTFPLSATFQASVGYFRETITGVSTSKVDGEVALSTDQFLLDPLTSWSASVYARRSWYGTGANRMVYSGSIGVTRSLDQWSSVGLSYTRTFVEGSTPFRFDSVSPTSAVSAGYSRRVEGQYHFNFGISHDFLVPETKLSAEVGVQVARDLSFTVSAVYNLRTAAYEDVDYVLTKQCDCVEVSVKYRQVRREWWVEIGLVAFPQTRFTYQFPRP
jgi:lipopolysaccharide assembly outer membrane protein LptD (OstA)